MTLPPRYRQYLEYKTACEQALTEAGLTEVIVTADALTIPSAARHGVICFPPPDIAFTSHAITDVTFDAVVIAGPPDNLDHAWRTLDSIIEALFQANLNLKSAEADSFTPERGMPPLAGYALSFHPLTVYKEKNS